MMAVRHDGRALKFASPTLRDDREVVIESVRQDSWALQFASEERWRSSNALSRAVFRPHNHRCTGNSCKDTATDANPEIY